MLPLGWFCSTCFSLAGLALPAGLLPAKGRLGRVEPYGGVGAASVACTPPGWLIVCRRLRPRHFLPISHTQIPFPGSLHITSARLCFVFEDKAIAPIKLPAKSIKPGGVSKLPADADKGKVGRRSWQELAELKSRGAPRTSPGGGIVCTNPLQVQAVRMRVLSSPPSSFGVCSPPDALPGLVPFSCRPAGAAGGGAGSPGSEAGADRLCAC